jgi:hypothetical protein
MRHDEESGFCLLLTHILLLVEYGSSLTPGMHSMMIVLELVRAPAAGDDSADSFL